MDWFDSMTLRLRVVDRHVRIALAAEIGVRVLPIYEKYWVGAETPGVPRGVEMGWEYATGAPVDENERQAVLAELKDAASFYAEEDFSPTKEAVTAALRVVEALDDDEGNSAKAVMRALVMGQSAANLAEHMTLEHQPAAAKKGSATEEEEKWQANAIAIAEKWKGTPRRDMFDAAGPKPPDWLKRWEPVAATQ
jgi:hypothetical protein